MENRLTSGVGKIKGNVQSRLAIRMLLLLLFCMVGSGIKSQVPDMEIRNLINQVNRDSLISYVRILSGEDPVGIDSQVELISNRVSGTLSHQLAGNYIRQTLKRFGLKTYDQYFTGFSWIRDEFVSGKNIYAVQEGVDTTTQYIICAHYDAITDYCADDNASGTAVVLEAARILSRIKPEHTVIYAFWDQEEAWLIGSSCFAARADSLHQNIQGVLNLDMLGWDGNMDGRAEIHTNNYGNSVGLARKLGDLNSIFSLGLHTVILNPGKATSDQCSFWGYNYTAVLLIEAYSGNDFNPYYHSTGDRISVFNREYFHKIAKLAIAGIRVMSSDMNSGAEGIENSGTTFDLEQNVPNPASKNTTFRFYLPERALTSLSIYNSTGCRVADLILNTLDRGSHQITWDVGDFPPGLYFYKLQSGENCRVNKMVILKK